MAERELELFYFDQCPYCQIVLNHIQTHELPVTLRNTQTDPNNHVRLKAVGGKTQVPCLFIDGQPLYESQDIINWLTQHA